jgi:hypothetical protein
VKKELAAFYSVSAATIVPIAALTSWQFLRVPTVTSQNLLLPLKLGTTTFLVAVVPGLFLAMPWLLLSPKAHSVNWQRIAMYAFLCAFAGGAGRIKIWIFTYWTPAAHMLQDATVLARYGFPTREGWIFLLSNCTLFGAIAAFAALCGYITWDRLTSSNHHHWSGRDHE